MEAFCGSCGSLLVSLEVFSPAQILLIVHTTVIHHSVFSFSSFFYISSFWNLEICSCLYSSLLSILLILLFFPTLLSAPCSVLSVCLFTLFSDLTYCFIFIFAVLSFLFSYYCILSASSLWPIMFYSICSLIVILHLLRTLYLILLCSCSCFLYTPSF